MNPLTQFKRIQILPLLIAVSLVARAPVAQAADLSATPVIDWSNEARRAIVPPSAGPDFILRTGRQRKTKEWRLRGG